MPIEDFKQTVPAADPNKLDLIKHVIPVMEENGYKMSKKHRKALEGVDEDKVAWKEKVKGSKVDVSVIKYSIIKVRANGAKDARKIAEMLEEKCRPFGYAHKVIFYP